MTDIALQQAPSVIQINAAQSLIGLAVIVLGIGAAWGTLKTSVNHIKDSLRKIEPDLKDIREKFFAFEGKYSTVFQTQSPIQLLPKGVKILEDSGLKDYIDRNEDKLLANCKSGNSMSNPYDIQESAFKYFDEINLPELEENIKTTAFEQGVSTDIVKRIGGIYFRDACLRAHNYKPEDLDNPKGL